MADDYQAPSNPIAMLMSADTSGHGGMKQICTLSPEEYQRYKDAYLGLYRVFFWNPFTYFRASAKEFHSVWSEANNALVKHEIRPMTEHEGTVHWITKLRSAALSLCLSLCYHQEQTYRRIRGDFGKGSAPDEAATAIFGQLYDSYSGYRYMYSLRNVMVHEAMDAISLTSNSWLNQDNEAVGLWSVTLNRSILSKAEKLKASMREEFSALAENPSLPELFAQIADPIADANAKLLSIAYPDLTDSCEIVLEFDALFGGEAGIRALVESAIPTSTTEMKLNMMIWSSEVIEFARQYEAGQQIRR